MNTLPDPRLVKALITLENRYGGLVTNVPRNHVSPYDPRTKEQLARGGMIGGDRMSRHGYAPKYAQYLKKFLYKKDLVLVEVGILMGTGLAVWCDIFRNATILGLDIDLEHFNSNKSKLISFGAFRKNKPTLFNFDQLDSKIPDPLLRQLEKTGIDIVIDDGLHTSQAITNTIKMLKPFLKKDWIYFIEDNPNGQKLSEQLFKGCAFDRDGELTIITPKCINEDTSVMADIYQWNCSNSLPPSSEITITLAGPKLHGIFVTESKLHYHGSITIDQVILEAAGFYPLEFVNIWNKNSGARLSTYILPGKKGSGVCCLNGAAARSCQVGDQIIVTSERSLPRKLISSYSVNVLTFTNDNKIAELIKYKLDLSPENCHFSLLEQQSHGV